jgi:hypothetical protein
MIELVCIFLEFLHRILDIDESRICEYGLRLSARLTMNVICQVTSVHATRSKKFNLQKISNFVSTHTFPSKPQPKLNPFLLPKMRLTADLIQGSLSYINPLNERELDLRGVSPQEQMLHFRSEESSIDTIACPLQATKSPPLKT